MNNYHLLKWVSLAIGVISSPISFFVGYSWAIGHYQAAGIVFFLTILLWSADFFIGWRMFELLLKRDNDC